ncbi:hypothetical protein L1987_37721 [Smallanthus sonchifolius]|uniref:Uncharacterized protein n=1 Tax=Smallanthus sonchifolius TaxID=185202 RepID=A0ACB9HHJ7_9ASTR|nr:hypothetical protein L1987_37721 [Smallanthus sonchifolius]
MFDYVSLLTKIRTVLEDYSSEICLKGGCLLVRRCYFHNDPRNIISIGGEVLGCRGFHSRFRASQAGLCFNMGNWV